MSSRFSISIADVVNLLGLERDPKSVRAITSFNVRCPFCGDTKYHMNINTIKNTYHCVLCMDGMKGTGALDLYGRVALGVSHQKGAGGNGKELYRKLCEALNFGSPVAVRKSAMRLPQPVQVLRADDSTLDKTYRGLLSITYFKLSDQHKANLMKRGLSANTIIANRYRTIGTDFSWTHNHPKIEEMYHAEKLGEICEKNELLQYCTPAQIVAGLVVAKTLEKRGCTLDGVPGFFKIGKHWCFKLEPGMIIPTRNMNGQIVALQSRKDTGNLRYMTISSKGLPSGVTEGISRAHFPLKNATLNANTEVLLTEGPLKGDVAVELLNSDNVFVIALQGVHNKAELPAILSHLKDAGVKRVINAFDMDKLTNPFVAKAVSSVKAMAKEYGLELTMRCWDTRYAQVKLNELTELCREHNIPVTATKNIFADIANLAKLLSDRNIEHSIVVLDNGKELKNYWSEKTKGIDDFLLGQLL